MGKILDWMLGGPPVAAAATFRPEVTAAATLPHQVGIKSPMAEPDHLSSIVWADLTGTDALMLDRASVMAIPAVARQRHLICGVGARCPLRLVDPNPTPPTILADQPDWMTQGTGSLSAYHRMIWTLDDLIFHPFSVWACERQGGPAGPLVWVERIPTTRWSTDEDDTLLVDDRPVDESAVIVIPGPHEGILSFGAPALARTIDNLEAAARAARNPSAYLELHYVGTEPVSDTAKEAAIQDWARARRGETAGVAWTNANLELKEHGTHEAHLLIEGRNADAVDVSRLVSSPAAMADATNAGASLTYETSEGRNAQFLDYGAALYMDAVAARLSMDDVSPAGTGVAFDVSRLTVPAVPSTTTNTQE